MQRARNHMMDENILKNSLLEATNGKIFFDGLGLMTSVRQLLAYLPEDIRIKKLAGNLLIMVYPKKIAPKEKTLRVCTVADTRYGLCDIKTLNLMPNVLAAQEAEGMGCDEAVFVRDGEVTECAHSNVHILTGGVLLSPPPCYCTLDGIGRRHLLTACAELFVPVVERRFSPEEMKRADEIIVTSAGYPCQRVVECDKAPCGQKGGRLFDALSDAIYKELREKTK